MSSTFVMALVLLIAVVGKPAVVADWGCPFKGHFCDLHCRRDLKCKGGYCNPTTLFFICKCDLCPYSKESNEDSRFDFEDKTGNKI
ncbi:hypothetical protein ACJMK2_023612 [Sinanodonta woodiana]|uniref:Defensin n=1 Tax=Sinanodonta woodiana TaxID=1069815 RepID=A0ABD3T6G1_SINWO